ncbi:MAG: TIGR03118 family protein [Bacteroidia bacterium]|nr:TIGR03118 family protein [Bacteroidia bacterium]
MNIFRMIYNKIIKRNFTGIIIIILSIIVYQGCKKDNASPAVSNYQTVKLVADTAGYSAGRIDASLLNAWGIAIGPTGEIWISVNHSGLAVIYDNNGAQISAPVNIPLGAAPNGASPDGVIYNNTSDFSIPGNGTSLYIFSTEDGLLSAWNVSTVNSTMTVADRSAAGAVYKGIAMASDGGANFIYATDFYNAKIDVFDKDFALVTTKPFNDPGIPTGFAPFNIQNIGGQLFVTYAKQLAPDNHDDQAGPGNGYVDIYTTAGILVKRFATQGTLNSPWGIAQAPAAFGQVANAILIGNFGDGHINVYNPNGVYQGQLSNNGTVISIPGLWAITFDNVSPANPDQLFFTAGPGSEAHGLFGYLTKI